jgi:predicted small lipoprotein YifL
MRCWANNLFIVIVVLLGTLAMLGACGQKGDLYLPEPASESGTPPGADVPTLPPAPLDSEAAGASQP